MPKGPTDPRTLRAKVKLAVAALREHDQDELADAVAEFLQLKTTKPQDKPNLPMYMSSATWERAKAAVAAEGRTMEDEVEAGYTALLSGRWVPDRHPRARHGSGASAAKTTKNVRVATERTEQVAAYVAAHAEAWGWSPSPAQVGAAWLEAKHGSPSRD
ncbi:hypothetical protein ACIGZJ_30750 [Kitasatospora sp. NPDC052868]|uniref:hypothetical protein n=1 Tax=Kitasatospora sp. NPDC052868 TaxID=3364060 RepID=UPI0037C64AA8